MYYSLLFIVSLFTLANFARSQCLTEDDNAGPNARVSAQMMSKASLKYTTEQFKKLIADKPGRNLFISPYSIWSALTLTYLGAKGSTGDQLAKVLGFGDVDRATVGRGYLQLVENMRKIQDNSKSTLAVASKVIFDDNVNVKECMVESYFDDLARVNFTTDPEESRDRINFWVENQTENVIKDLIPAGGITALTKMVIVNAVYFKGEWYHMFNEAATVKDSFKVAPGDVRKVDMMKIKTELFYGEDANLGAQLVELPYSSGDFSMLILVPFRTNTVDDVINKLNPESFDDAVSQMLEANVILRMPKFKLEDEHDMVNVLSEMGIKDLFGNADLSGYTDEHITVSNVIHKAVIDVNEKGTEAAGSTAVIMSRTSRILSDITMNVDKPFVFVIRDNNQNVVLFMGVVNNPGGEKVRRGLRYF